MANTLRIPSEAFDVRSSAAENLRKMQGERNRGNTIDNRTVLPRQSVFGTEFSSDEGVDLSCCSEKRYDFLGFLF